MPTYISIPTEKEATQFDGTNLLPGMDWDMSGAFVITIHLQKTYVMPLDFIVTEPDGIHHYPVKPKIFLSTHKLKTNTVMDELGTQSAQATAVLSFGQKAVGLTFNPSNNPEVDAIKRAYAENIDLLNGLREATTSPEKKRMYSIAITELQSSQMWAVKSSTWQY